MAEPRHIIDHYELLIRLDENMKSVLNEIKEMREMQAQEMKGIMTRIMSVETFMAENSLVRKVVVWDETAQFVHDFRKSWKLIVSVIVGVSGFISWVVSNFLHVWRPN